MERFEGPVVAADLRLGCPADEMLTRAEDTRCAGIRPGNPGDRPPHRHDQQ
jgi:hypothetical protein